MRIVDTVLYGKVQRVAWSGRAGVAVSLELSPAAPAHGGAGEGVGRLTHSSIFKILMLYPTEFSVVLLEEQGANHPETLPMPIPAPCC